ncbi:hypothetical protein BofuT4_uP066410.1 [Botrytis cinerea T4]|uniref:Uncharacterized protein n=1 Tax=Botryotinia fuckeliana (strain T4) TaxID=999810 RepID=G2XRM0_BOTF4|nr:hypothetical protein BofuT4_uP066410.1 [Botrytis cinerea T4]
MRPNAAHADIERPDNCLRIIQVVLPSPAQPLSTFSIMIPAALNINDAEIKHE